MMKEILINDINDLIQVVNAFPSHFLFRGQANADWRMETSLERILGTGWSSEQAQKLEEFSLIKFKSKFHLYDKENIQPTSKLAWLSLMQHYGVPTRLLDFTESPYVALYFALEFFNVQSNKDFSLFAIDYREILDKSIALIKGMDSGFREDRNSIEDKKDEIFESTVDRFAYEIAWVTEPKLLNVRLDLQAGSFLLSGNRGKKISEVLDLPIYENVRIEKYIISKELYMQVFTLLRKMNITSKSLYGDLDGVARGIRMEMQVYSI